MTLPSDLGSPRENRLLAALPRDERDRLAPHLQAVSLEAKKVIHEAEEPISYVYFPRPGLALSHIVRTNGSGSEVGSIGCEGMAGLPVFLGTDNSIAQAIIQLPGEALRMKASIFRDEVQRAATLTSMLQRYTQVFLTQVMQAAACNHRHSIEERMCRWLLTCHDRAASSQLLLTQDFLASMLGVRRPSVTVVAGILQRAGLIEHQRGRITVLDRPGLEEVACECYGIVARESRRLLGWS